MDAIRVLDQEPSQPPSSQVSAKIDVVDPAGIESEMSKWLCKRLKIMCR